MQIISDYYAAFRAANPEVKAEEAPVVTYEAGWFVFRYGGYVRARHRKAKFLGMLEVLRNRVNTLSDNIASE